MSRLARTSAVSTRFCQASHFSEEGPEICSLVEDGVRAMAGWLPDNLEMAGCSLNCIGLGEGGSTILARCLLDPSTKAQQPDHTDLSSLV